MTDAGKNLARVYLVRHGETAWSLSGQHTSRTDLSLTEHGKAQSRAVGAVLQGITFSRVFSSPRLRARQTCHEIGWDPATVELRADMVEWDYGDYEGLRSVEIRERRPGWSIFVDGCPGGETPAEISARADGLIAALRALGENVAICSHGHFGRVLGARWIGLPVAHAQQLLLDTASVSILGYERHTDTPAIASWNARA